LANPYHDGAGRFCSKGGMRTAIQDAAKAGDTKTYLALRTDYEATSGEVYMPEAIDNKARKSSGSGSKANLKGIAQRRTAPKPKEKVLTATQIAKRVAEARAANEKAVLEQFPNNRPITGADLDNIQNPEVRDFVTSVTERDKVTVTPYDVHLIEEASSDAFSAGYGEGYSKGYGDYRESSDDFNLENETKSLIEKTTFQESTNPRLVSELKEILDKRYQEGSDQGHWDS